MSLVLPASAVALGRFPRLCYQAMLIELSDFACLLVFAMEGGLAHYCLIGGIPESVLFP